MKGGSSDGRAARSAFGVGGHKSGGGPIVGCQ